MLEFRDEHLVSIHGYYSDIRAWGDPATVIRSLTLETNRRTYGPFGVEEGTKFSFPIMGTNVVGVYGRSGWYLDAIGLYLGTSQEYAFHLYCFNFLDIVLYFYDAKYINIYNMGRFSAQYSFIMSRCLFFIFEFGFLRVKIF